MEHSHRVITRRDNLYPFQPHWGCVCGHKFKATLMGPALYKEFTTHAEEEESHDNRNPPAR